jgi:hypothetical protein
MNFLNPLILFGLAAAAIPILLHIFNLRKLKKVEFSTLRFLEELQKTKIRRLKLKQWLLLILRTLLVIFAVLAFARPTIEGTLPFFESYANTSSVIILDNSFSIDVSDENGSRLNQAKKASENILSQMKDGDETVLLTNNELTNRNDFTRDKNVLLDEIRETGLSFNKFNLNDKIRIAQTKLIDAKNLNKEIYIISDAQPNIFELPGDSVKMSQAEDMAYFAAFAAESKAEILNISIDSVNVLSTIFQKGKITECEAFITNHSDNDFRGLVLSLSFDGNRVAQRSFDISAGESVTINIAAVPQTSGPVKAILELEGDAFEPDNSRHFGFIIPPARRIALITENNSNRFLLTALRAFAEDDDEYYIDDFTPDEFPSVDINNYGALIIASGLREADFSRLSAYLNTGGSIFITSYDEIKQSPANTFLEENGIQLGEKLTFGINQTGSITSADLEHPLFEGVFREDDAAKTIESPEIIRAVPAKSGLPLINMSGGIFLSEGNNDNGRLLYLGISPTTEWSNFPFTGLFPVVVNRSVSYLTAGRELSSFFSMDENIRITLPQKYSNLESVKIIDPNGLEFFRGVIKLPGAALVEAGLPEIPGVYNIFTEKGEIIEQYAVNTSSSESILEPVEAGKITEFYQNIFDDDVALEIISDTESIGENINQVRAGTELWKLFLMLALLAAAAEMIVQRVSKNET